MDCFNGDHYFNTSRVAKTKTKAVNLQTVSLDIQIHSQFFHQSTFREEQPLTQEYIYFLVLDHYLRITPAKTVNTVLLTKWVSIYS